jgi:predicted DsbA family dithiol-disulfide isomerase
VQLEIWSDVACPWCAVGKRRLDTALDAFEHRDEVEVRWRSFELDPDAPARHEGAYVDRLARKYGTDRAGAQTMLDRMTDTAAQDGWTFDLERIRAGSTFDAHRLLHLAADHGRQHEVTERLLRGYLEEAVAIGEPGALAPLAVEAGLPEDEVAEVLGSDRYASAVRADEQLAARLGIRAVPCFVLDRSFAVDGAQPAEVLLGALRRAWDDGHRGAAATATPTDPRQPDHPHDHDPDGVCVDGRCAV